MDNQTYKTIGEVAEEISEEDTTNLVTENEEE